jgi:hypothetical protein
MTPDEAIAQKFRRVVRWMFLNRRNGRFTVTQWPNVALSVYIALSIALRFNIPKGTPETTLRILSIVAIITWAADELVRGVNPFRRILGFGVLLATITSIALR